MNTLLNSFEFPGWAGVFEILVLAIIFYYIFQFLRGTRGMAVLSGFVLVVIVLIGLTRLFDLDALYWLVQRVLVYLAIAVVVIFQPEIRRALAQLGRQSSSSKAAETREVVDVLTQAVRQLADRKIGALIAIEREIRTGGIQETGIRMDSEVSVELLETIFFPRTAMHDGGVLIRGNRIMAASCLFPLSQREGISSKLGTRHRAAIGITEETDALVIVVSEETGVISVAFNGRLRRGLEEEHLRRVLSSLMSRAEQKSVRNRVREAMSLSGHWTDDDQAFSDE